MNNSKIGQSAVSKKKALKVRVSQEIAIAVHLNNFVYFFLDKNLSIKWMGYTSRWSLEKVPWISIPKVNLEGKHSLWT